MLFSVKVMSKGNVLFGSTLTMRTLQKTFSLAVSREMSPAARIVCYVVKDGEILTDSLNFHVRDKRLLNVRRSIVVTSQVMEYNSMRVSCRQLSERIREKTFAATRWS